MKRVVTIVNKWWECVPIVGTLLNANATPINFPWSTALVPARLAPVPQSQGPLLAPRAVFTSENTNMEIWCVGDLMVQTTPARQSSSEDKARFLPPVVGSPDLVISISTASSSDANISLNGCVQIGTKVFMHDGHPAADPNPLSCWHVGPFDTVIDSPLSETAFEAIFQAIPTTVAAKFTPVRNTPAPTLKVNPVFENTALCTINVSDPAEYNAKDALTVSAFKSLGNVRALPASVETTHGIVRTASPSPFIFISPIVNRLSMYAQETASNLFPQITAACMNAAVTLAWVFTSISQHLKTDTVPN